MPFLPMSREEMQARGWDELDVLLVSGDAYVDHPSFGTALIGRWLESNGFRVGIVAQPRWDTVDDITVMGRPRLFASVSAGALDSMLAHYTAFRKKRSDDAYTPGGMSGARPNRACLVYTGLVRQAFSGLPVILGGIEASLRRATHYDFWTDKLRKSILLDSKADAITYGMAENGVLDIAKLLQNLSEGKTPTAALWSRASGCCFATKESELAQLQKESAPWLESAARFPAHEEIERDKKKLLALATGMEKQVHEVRGAVQFTAGRVVVSTPLKPLTTEEIDKIYSLPFLKQPHPRYKEPIPAVTMIRFSLTSHRGCGGGCSFCSLALHQGRKITSRSEASILHELQQLTRHPHWDGALTDIGGPSANMWGAFCKNKATCNRTSCLAPTPCPHFQVDARKHIALLRKAVNTPKVKHVRIASGVRFDLSLLDTDCAAVFAQEFVGGQLKLAPEHSESATLRRMRKPEIHVFEKYLHLFEQASQQAGKRQYVIPYLMSAFPGCTDSEMKRLAEWLRARGWQPQQVQCFIPTPATVATAMFYAGIDTDGNAIHVARTDAERLRQHGILMGTAQNNAKPPHHRQNRPNRIGKPKRRD